MSKIRSRTLRDTAVFTATVLAIEFLAEFVFGIRETAWPLIRTDLGLDYVQVGILLAVPSVLSSVTEPVLGILGDVWRRFLLILGGGAPFALALLLADWSPGFATLLVSFAVLYPGSGAFVTLSQATLMDDDPDRREQNTARWTFAGSLGVLAGPLALVAATTMGFGWRWPFLFSAALALGLLLVAARAGLAPRQLVCPDVSFGGAAMNALRAVRRGEVLRWLTLLEFSDLILDVLLGFLALYLVDVAGASPYRAGLAVAVWTGMGLLGDLLVIPLLERMRGAVYVRLSAAVELVAFAAFLFVPTMGPKVLILGPLGPFNAGSYSVLQAQLYQAMPGQSGAVMAVSNLLGLVGGLMPLGLGFAAQRFGLGLAMWLLLLGPVASLVGLPRRFRFAAV